MRGETLPVRASQDNGQELLPVKHQPGQGASLGIVPRSLDELDRFAHMAHASGLFNGVDSMAKAAVKIATGAEMGLTPMASLRSLHIFQDKVEMSAHLVLALCKQAGYRYRVLQADKQAAMIEWQDKHGNLLGPPVGFTIDDARAAGLLGKDVWKKYPEDMLWARAVSRGARRYCPEITHGVYVDGEISDAPPLHGPTQPPPRSLPYNRAPDHAAPDAPQGGQHEAPPTEDPERQKQMRRLHAVGRERGLNHDRLRELIGLESLKEADTGLLWVSCELLSAANMGDLRFAWDHNKNYWDQLHGLKDWCKEQLLAGEAGADPGVQGGEG